MKENPKTLITRTFKSRYSLFTRSTEQYAKALLDQNTGLYNVNCYTVNKSLKNLFNSKRIEQKDYPLKKQQVELSSAIATLEEWENHKASSHESKPLKIQTNGDLHYQNFSRLIETEISLVAGRKNQLSK